jgi:hypothetical protein
MRVGKGRNTKGIKGEEGWQNLRELGLIERHHVREISAYLVYATDRS